MPSLEPGHVGGSFNHVVTVPTGDGDERNSLGIVTDLLDKVGNFLDDFFVTGFGVVVGVHLVDGDDQLLDTQSEGQQGVFTSLTVLGNTGFEFTSTGSNDQNGAVSLDLVRIGHSYQIVALLT
jgi:hypothetical protein